MTDHSSTVINAECARCAELEAALEDALAKGAALFWMIPNDVASNIRLGDVQEKWKQLLGRAQQTTLPGLVTTLRSNADDCENPKRWATPELAPLLRRAADVIEAMPSAQQTTTPAPRGFSGAGEKND